MTEILFYHLTERSLAQVLPGLVEKSLDRKWRVVIQAADQTRIDEIDDVLWTWRDDSFIPHGTVRDGMENLQPVWLTTRDDNPNHATVRFLVEKAELDDPNGYERVVYLFDGQDNGAVEHARGRWKFHKEQGIHDQTYWQQENSGRWVKKA